MCTEEVVELPRHHFHLGGENYVVVSVFSNKVNVHIRKYIRDERQRLIPTKEGVTLSPLMWESLLKTIEYKSLPSRTDEIVTVRGTLMLSGAVIEDVPYAVLQCFFQKKNFSRYFLPNVCLLNEKEWQNLHGKVSESVISVMFENLFVRFLEREISKQMPNNLPDVDKSDADMILSTSLIEIMKDHWSTKISELFHCSGCEAGFENQLGHECITLNYDNRMFQYGHSALFSIDLEKLASDFVNQNAHIINYANDVFLKSIDMLALVENAKKMYIACDPIPLRMF